MNYFKKIAYIMAFVCAVPVCHATETNKEILVEEQRKKEDRCSTHLAMCEVAAVGGLSGAFAIGLTQLLNSSTMICLVSLAALCPVFTTVHGHLYTKYEHMFDVEIFKRICTEAAFKAEHYVNTMVKCGVIVLACSVAMAAGQQLIRHFSN